MRRIGKAALSLVTFALACSAEPGGSPEIVTGSLKLEPRYSTFHGTGKPNVRSIAMDADGNVYVSGGTNDPAFPLTAPMVGAGGDSDVVVFKLSPEGQLLWSAGFGGPGEDYAYVSDLTPDGQHLIVGGRSGPGFPVTSGAFDTSFNGGVGSGMHGPTDGFVLSVSADGALEWATYIGGEKDDNVRAMAVLPDGGIAVGSGNSESPDLPVTPGAYQTVRRGGKDGWIAVLLPDGSDIDFLTYFGTSDEGGREDETIRALAAGPNGEIWFGGTTVGTDLTTTPDAFQATQPGGVSAFVGRLHRDGSRVTYLSWLGGSGSDEIETEGRSDPDGGFHVAGGTTSPDFPVGDGSERRAARGGGDGFVARIAPDGRLEGAALFGGSADGYEVLFGPAPGPDGTVWAAGMVQSEDVPITAEASRRVLGGVSDPVLVGFGPGGEIRASTLWGGDGRDQARAVAVHADGRRVAIAGPRPAGDFPLVSAFQSEPNAAWVAVFDVRPVAGAAASSEGAGDAR